MNAAESMRGRSVARLPGGGGLLSPRCGPRGGKGLPRGGKEGSIPRPALTPWPPLPPPRPPTPVDGDRAANIRTEREGRWRPSPGEGGWSGGRGDGGEGRVGDVWVRGLPPVPRRERRFPHTPG